VTSTTCQTTKCCFWP